MLVDVPGHRYYLAIGPRCIIMISASDVLLFLGALLPRPRDKIGTFYTYLKTSQSLRAEQTIATSTSNGKLKEGGLCYLCRNPQCWITGRSAYSSRLEALETLWKFDIGL